jgi:hypothetical protein
MSNCLISLIIAATLGASAAQAAINDSPSDRDAWFDITVLEAHARLDLTLRQLDAVETCDKVKDEWIDEGRAGRNHYEHFDCTRSIESRLNATAFKALPLWVFRNGFLTTELDTPLIEVYTVTPLDRMEQATALGFSESYQGGRVNLFKANGIDGKTHEARQVRLRDGRIGIVHRWIAPFDRNGNAGGFELRAVPFKPVLTRNVGGEERRYWDRLIGDGMFHDYAIANFRVTDAGRYLPQAPNGYDRSAELLLP